MNSIEHIEIQNDYESESKLKLLIANENIDGTQNLLHKNSLAAFENVGRRKHSSIPTIPFWQAIETEKHNAKAFEFEDFFPNDLKFHYNQMFAYFNKCEEMIHLISFIQHSPNSTFHLNPMKKKKPT